MSTAKDFGTSGGAPTAMVTPVPHGHQLVNLRHELRFDVEYQPDYLPYAVQMWLVRLKLTDWVVRVQLVTERGMGSGDVARIACNQDHKHASLQILTRDDYYTGREETPAILPYDQDLCIVHELLHIMQNPITQHLLDEENDTLRRVLMTALETGIETTAQSIVCAYRQFDARFRPGGSGTFSSNLEATARVDKTAFRAYTDATETGI